jgi:hypothetical protein
MTKPKPKPKPKPPANAGPKQGGKFQKGKSGNPAGKKPGTRNRTTLALESLLDGEGAKITRRAIKLALKGDPVALRICMDRLLPPRRERPVSLPTMSAPANAAGISQALGSVIHAVCKGRLTPSEGGALANILQVQARVIEAVDLEKRIADLEQQAKGGTQ